MNAIEVSNLSKDFGSVRALNGVSFVVPIGSITGFLGPNGAGKSTTMNILIGAISATAGTAKLFDEIVSVNNVASRKSLGFLTNSTALDRTLTVGQELDYFSHLDGQDYSNYTKQLVEQLDLNLSQKIVGLSTGNYQKVALIIALMSKPKLLILDEPTNGLDPLVQAEFNNIILQLRDSGSSIFISSHILSEVDQLCDEFIFIKNGKIVGQLSKAELNQQNGGTITITASANDRTRVLEVLRKNRIDYQLAAGDLDQIFRKYYEDSHA
ncbi:MAG: ABC transporter ATP-binding protein [Bifidobacteriaceae bacterium]|jgi:ABC-2 type transport system ATP-binding protein|nr:ABC transporter ATP-binding protein [Bifidobacteriaceae bacterium]